MSPRMMFLVLAIATLLHGASFGATDFKEKDSDPSSMSEKQARALAVYAPQPDYPYEARLKWLTGRGSILLNVDAQTGYVTSARILENRTQNSQRCCPGGVSPLAIQTR